MCYITKCYINNTFCRGLSSFRTFMKIHKRIKEKNDQVNSHHFHKKILKVPQITVHEPLDK